MWDIVSHIDLFNKSYLSQVRHLTLELPWYNPVDYYYVELTKENTFGDNPDERNYLKTLRVKCIPSVCWVMALKVLCCRMNSFAYTVLKFSQFLLSSSICSLLQSFISWIAVSIKLNFTLVASRILITTRIIATAYPAFMQAVTHLS